MQKRILLADSPEDLEKLHQKSEKVEKVGSDTKKLVQEMFESMKAGSGIGLSAPQIGVLKRVMIAEYKSEKDPVPRTVLINPEIIWTSKKEELDEEGCLSFPNIYGIVRRPEKIRYKALDENGQPIEKKATGLLARIIQHEIDHLNGVLFPDRVEGDLYTYEIRDESKTL